MHEYVGLDLSLWPERNRTHWSLVLRISVVEDRDRHGEGIHPWMACRSLICGNYTPDISQSDLVRQLVAVLNSVGLDISIYHLNDTHFIIMSVNGTLEGMKSLALVIYLTLNSLKDPRMVIWFDIDNTLYSASTKISHTMGERIHGMFTHNRYKLFLKVLSAAYFVSLGLDEDEASELHHKYYTQYGLALRGLARHHDIGNCLK